MPMHASSSTIDPIMIDIIFMTRPPFLLGDDSITKKFLQEETTFSRWQNQNFWLRCSTSGNETCRGAERRSCGSVPTSGRLLPAQYCGWVVFKANEEGLP